MEASPFDLAPTADGQRIQEEVRSFLDTHVLPVVDELRTGMETLEGDEPFTPLMSELRARARAAGLWNLFHSDPAIGPGLSNLDYGHVCELTGIDEWAPTVFNCNFPDTGNMEVLHENCTPAQRRRWLDPLLEGDTRSCFALTEPDTASSDPTAITTTARRDGDDWVIDGRKWYITGASGAAVCVAMVVTSPEAERHRRVSVLLVPMDAPGLRFVRRLEVFGSSVGPSHWELAFEECRVGADALLGAEGGGFQIAQDRLGPGRIHHCMRQIGAAERALALAAQRAASRPHRDGTLGDTQLVRLHLSESRIQLDAARLLVLRAARAIDLYGKRRAYRDISIAKIHTARMTQDVADRAIQIHGALGFSQDSPLPRIWVGGRALRIGDGADEVHHLTIAKHELGRSA